MKKFTLLFIVTTLIFRLTADAQISKGSLFLGGDLGGSTQKTKSNGTIINKQEGLNISPVFGKAIKENFILGINAGLGLYENNTGASTNSQRSKSYGAGIFIRKYKQISKSPFSIFLQGGLGVNYNSNENVSPFSNFLRTKRYTISITAYPGISYTVSKRLQLETGFNNLFSLNYFTEKREFNTGPSSTERTNGINISSSLNNLSSLYLGFRVLINK